MTFFDARLVDESEQPWEIDPVTAGRRSFESWFWGGLVCLMQGHEFFPPAPMQRAYYKPNWRTCIRCDKEWTRRGRANDLANAPDRVARR